MIAKLLWLMIDGSRINDHIQFSIWYYIVLHIVYYRLGGIEDI